MIQGRAYSIETLVRARTYEGGNIPVSIADRPELLVILLQPLVKEPVVVRAAAPALEEPLPRKGGAASDDDDEGGHPDLGVMHNTCQHYVCQMGLRPQAPRRGGGGCVDSLTSFSKARAVSISRGKPSMIQPRRADDCPSSSFSLISGTMVSGGRSLLS